MRTLQQLAKELQNAVEPTNQEQNEEISFGSILETSLFGRLEFRRKRLIDKINLSIEEVELVKDNILYFYE